jgi:hypothetical protein
MLLTTPWTGQKTGIAWPWAGFEFQALTLPGFERPPLPLDNMV